MTDNYPSDPKFDQAQIEADHRRLWDVSTEYRNSFGDLKDQVDPYRRGRLGKSGGSLVTLLLMLEEALQTLAR